MKNADHLPNILRYLQILLGDGAYLSLRGVAIAGLLWLASAARRSGRAGVVGRFGVLVGALTLAVYAPYFWQAPRFLLGVASLLNVGATLALLEALRLLRAKFAPPCILSISFARYGMDEQVGWSGYSLVA